MDRALAARGDAVPPDGSARVIIKQLDGCTFGLQFETLVDHVGDVPPARWQSTLEGYFASQQAEAEVIRSQFFGQGFARLRMLLRPRLLQRELLPDRVQPLQRNLGADLIAVLEVEGPQTCHWAAASDKASWNVAESELWSAALPNLRQQDHHVDQQGAYSLVTGHSGYVASQALRLGELLPAPPPHGVLVGLPHPDVMIFHPVVGMGSVLFCRSCLGSWTASTGVSSAR